MRSTGRSFLTASQVDEAVAAGGEVGEVGGGQDTRGHK